MAVADLRERLYGRAVRAGECLVWQGCVSDDGYGHIRLRPDDSPTGLRAMVKTHHLSWYLEHGEWPKYIRHSCDTPACVEPAHLLDGTHADNMQDRVRRGRAPWQGRTECPRGHPYPGTGPCRPCRNLAARRRYRIKKAGQ